MAIGCHGDYLASVVRSLGGGTRLALLGPHSRWVSPVANSTDCATAAVSRSEQGDKAVDTCWSPMVANARCACIGVQSRNETVVRSMFSAKGAARSLRG